MRHTISIGFVVFLVSFTAFGPAFAATPTSLQEKLAENGFALGTEAQAITDYRLDDQVYLDSRHFILPDNSSRSYLVTLDKKCHGLYANKLFLRTRTRYQLVPRDVVRPQHQGRNLDRCEVVSIHQLVPR